MKKRSKPQPKDDFDPDVDDEEDEVYVVEEEEEQPNNQQQEEDDDAAFAEEDDMVVEEDEDFVGEDEDIPVPKNAKKSFSSTKRKPRAQSSIEEDELFPLGDFSSMPLLPDHERRPLWITEDGHLFLEMFQAARVYDFVITIAEPIFRPLLIHEWGDFFFFFFFFFFFLIFFFRCCAGITSLLTLFMVPFLLD
jgi:hypothetical protein